MLYRNLRFVPTSKSVQWESEALEKLTPSTVGRLKKGEGRQEEGKHEEELTDAITERGMSSSTFGVEVGMESEGRVQDYVANLEQGAKPVHHTEGKDIITLDNNTRFDKVHIHTIEVNSLYSHPPLGPAEQLPSGTQPVVWGATRERRSIPSEGK